MIKVTAMKKQKPLTKAQLANLKTEWVARNKKLKAAHLPKESFDQYLEFVFGRGRKRTIGFRVQPKSGSLRDYGVRHESLPDSVKGAVTTKQTLAYTGDAVIGIAQMAKSNAVPVFNTEAIVEIGKMRRG